MAYLNRVQSWHVQIHVTCKAHIVLKTFLYVAWLWWLELDVKWCFLVFQHCTARCGEFSAASSSSFWYSGWFLLLAYRFTSTEMFCLDIGCSDFSKPVNPPVPGWHWEKNGSLHLIAQLKGTVCLFQILWGGAAALTGKCNATFLKHLVKNRSVCGLRFPSQTLLNLFVIVQVIWGTIFRWSVFVFMRK